MEGELANQVKKGAKRAKVVSRRTVRARKEGGERGGDGFYGMY